MNALLPVVLAVSAAVVVALIHDATSLHGGPRTANLLLASLLLLAVAEHLLMVLPWQGTALWRWAMKRQQSAARAAQAAEAAAAGTR